jgi:hypothetical protein
MKAQYILILFCLILLCLSISWSAIHRTTSYQHGMSDLREQVKVGQDIYEARKRIEHRFHFATAPYFPKEDHNELWMNVSFGIQPGPMETLAYTTGLRLPFSRGERISAIVKATPAGRITAIE